MRIINNHDLAFGGMPAVLRALNTLADHISAMADLALRLAAVEERLTQIERNLSAPPTAAPSTSAKLTTDN